MIKLKSLILENGQRFINDPYKSGNVIIFHGTRQPRGIWKDGIIAGNAGVINKSGFKAVYASESLDMASSKTDHEEKLKQSYGGSIGKGDRWIVIASVPEKDVDIIVTSSDLRIYRNVLPEELIAIFPDNKTFDYPPKFKNKNTPYIKNEYKDFVFNTFVSK